MWAAKRADPVKMTSKVKVCLDKWSSWSDTIICPLTSCYFEP